MKTTCRKSWPVNFLQLSNLTFDPCFRIESIIKMKWPCISYMFVLGLGTEHLVGSLYVLQLKLFLRFYQVSILLPILLYLRAGVLAYQGSLYFLIMCL